MQTQKMILIGAATLAMAGCGGAADNNAPAADSNVEANAAAGIEHAPSVPLVGADGAILGEVSAGDSAEGAVLRINAKGIPAGTHGMHIHDVGSCEGPDFKSAGPHWNPDNKQHGMQNPQGPHRGDLPNVTVGEDGVLNVTATVENSNLRGSRAYGFANQIIDANGAALVIHAKADDMKTDPSGDSGDRIACAVLGEASEQPAAQ